MIVEMANVNPKDGIEIWQWVHLKLGLGALYVDWVDFMVYDVNRFEIVLDTRWMHNICPWYQIDHDSNEM